MGGGVVGEVESGSASGSVDYDPSTHYDRVTNAWILIMGPEFHYGLFASPDMPLGQASAALTALMTSLARPQRGERALDVGCGTGWQACRLAEEHGVSVLGITTSAAGVREATARAAALSSGLARFEVRDGTDNGLANDSFDLVWALESSHLMRDRHAMLSECSRVLRPGGRMVLCDIIRKREIPFLEVRRRRQDFKTLSSAFGDAHMLPIAFYENGLREAGLDIVHVEDLTAGTRPTLEAWRANAQAHRAEIVDTLGDAWLHDFVRATELLEEFWDDGTLGYGILAAEKPLVGTGDVPRV